MRCHSPTDSSHRDFGQSKSESMKPSKEKRAHRATRSGSGYGGGRRRNELRGGAATCHSTSRKRHCIYASTRHREMKLICSIMAPFSRNTEIRRPQLEAHMDSGYRKCMRRPYDLRGWHERAASA
ncbi:hypothetical protein CB0940_03621, partial [Cercospora beticola]